MAAASSRWPASTALVGINLAAAIIFGLYGLGPEGPRYARGSGRFSWLTGGAAAVLFAGLLAVQVWSPEPFLVRSSLEQEARTLVIRELQGMPEGFLASADVRFARADIPDQSTLLIVLHVQRRGDDGVGEQELGTRVVERVRRAIADAGMNVTPLVDVTVLDGP